MSTGVKGMITKKKISIVVIGFQEEDQRMYPHLYDFLQDIRAICDEVTYIPDDDRGEGLFIIEHYLRMFTRLIAGLFNLRKKHPLPTVNGGGTPCKINVPYIVYLVKQFVRYLGRQWSLIRKLKNLRFRNDARVVLAIDHTAAFFAARYVPGVPIVLWSYDILTSDAPWRIRNGFLERLITSHTALKPDVLMIQDEARMELMEASIGKRYREVLYLPVSLNDSEFCRADAAERGSTAVLENVRIIQSGWLARNRHTDKLVEVFQTWPQRYDLHLHGPLHGDEVTRVIARCSRKPRLSSDFLDHEALARFLGTFDIGFVGYGETDINHFYIENASAQLVGFLRLGIPVIVHLPTRLNDFVNNHGIGMGVDDLAGMKEAIDCIATDYRSYSVNARCLFEKNFNLNTILDTVIMPRLDDIAGHHEGWR